MNPTLKTGCGGSQARCNDVHSSLPSSTLHDTSFVAFIVEHGFAPVTNNVGWGILGGWQG